MLLIANPYVGDIYQLSDAYISNVSCTCMSFCCMVSPRWKMPTQVTSTLFFFQQKKKYMYASPWECGWNKPINNGMGSKT